MSTSISSVSPFTRAVIKSMKRLYPESLADKSFDNTGLLLEAPLSSRKRQKNSVLLTIDLTKSVVDEAIRRKDSVVVAYHPIIFRGLKSLTLKDSQQQSLLRLAQEGISVYCPHTAVDSVPQGMGDWLCDIVTRLPCQYAKPQLQKSPAGHYSSPAFPTPPPHDFAPSPVPHTRSTIVPASPPIPEGFESAGMGRIVTFSTPQPLSSIINRIACYAGCPAGIPIAVPQSTSVDKMQIRTVGVCPGSGAGVLINGTGETLPDLLFTGELSHHEALAVIERGSAVIALAHSNTERGYLHAVMRKKLIDTLCTEWDEERKLALKVLEEDAKQGGAGLNEGLDEMVNNPKFEVSVSESDRDPFGIMIRLD